MQTVICLGPRACDVGELFEEKETFQVKLIDKEIEGENCYGLQRQKTPEDYEKNVPDLSDFFKDVHNEILFITSGECDVLSCSLKILEQIKHKNISVIYLRPESMFLSKNGAFQDKLAFNVFQEYARSGLFKRVYLIDETLTELIMEDTPITEIYEEYLKLLHNIIVYINSLNEDSLIDHYSPPSDAARISTFAFYDLKTDSERQMYTMEMIEHKEYHFFFTEETINSDKKLMREIKEKLKNKVANGIKACYTIRRTNSSTDFCFVVHNSKAVQL
jgi:hypothetical protein